jgi:hypothetical protein
MMVFMIQENAGPFGMTNKRVRAKAGVQGVRVR